MPILKSILPLLCVLSSCTALSPARVSCYELLRPEHSLHSLLSLCVHDSQACTATIDRVYPRIADCVAASELQSAVGDVLGAIEGFFRGVLRGLQDDPNSSTACSSSFNTAQPYWDLMVQAAENVFTSGGGLPELFNVITLLDQFLTQLINSLERCNFEILGKRFSDLTTLEGVFKAMYVVGLNIEAVAVRFT